MKSKQELLNAIKNLIKEGNITQSDLFPRESSTTHTNQSKQSSYGLSDAFYLLGGAIVFIGITLFTGQHWHSLSEIAKVFITMGSGIAAYITGMILVTDSRTQTASVPFFILSSLLQPFGVYTVFSIAGISTSGTVIQIFISTLLFLINIFPFFLTRKNVFMFFSTIFGTSLFITLTDLIYKSLLQVNLVSYSFYSYRALMVGICYMILSDYFDKKLHASFAGFFYHLGTISVLSSALGLATISQTHALIWHISYPALIIGMMFLSVYTQRKLSLLWTTLFACIYVSTIVGIYFFRFLGIPLALISMGLGMITIGYASLALSKKYFPEN